MYWFALYSVKNGRLVLNRVEAHQTAHGNELAIGIHCVNPSQVFFYAVDRNEPYLVLSVTQNA